MYLSLRDVEQLELALRAPYNRGKRVKEQFQSIFVRVLNEKVERARGSRSSTKREVILKHFLRLAGNCNREALESLLNLLSDQEQEREEESAAEESIDKTLLEVARKNGNPEKS